MSGTHSKLLASGQPGRSHRLRGVLSGGCPSGDRRVCRCRRVVYISSGAATGLNVRRSGTGRRRLQAVLPSRRQLTARRPTGLGRPKTAATCSLPRGRRTSDERPADRRVRSLELHRAVAYWVDRVAEYDRVVVPSDGLAVADGLRRGRSECAPSRRGARDGWRGHNVGDEHAPTLREWVDRLARVHETDVETIGVGERELRAAGLAPDDFPIYRDSPHLLSTAKLRGLAGRRRPTKRCRDRRRLPRALHGGIRRVTPESRYHRLTEVKYARRSVCDYLERPLRTHRTADGDAAVSGIDDQRILEPEIAVERAHEVLSTSTTSPDITSKSSSEPVGRAYRSATTAHLPGAQAWS